MTASSTPILFGPVSIDRWLDDGVDLPGGGTWNIAVHWARSGVAFRLLSRVGAEDCRVILRLIEAHHIEALPSLVQPGSSATIDVRIRPDRQPWMDRFQPGVWAQVSLTAGDVEALRQASGVHAVLVDPVLQAMHRLAEDGVIGGASGPEVSVDLLDLRHLDDTAVARIFRWADVAFLGWQGALDDPRLEHLLVLAERTGTVLVATLGADGMVAADGRTGRTGLAGGNSGTGRTGLPGGRVRVPIRPREVLGTTVGCGDAFAAAFLRYWWGSSERDLRVALEQGAALGAEATAWRRPLPEEAYHLS